MRQMLSPCALSPSMSSAALVAALASVLPLFAADVVSAVLLTLCLVAGAAETLQQVRPVAASMVGRTHRRRLQRLLEAVAVAV